MIVYIVRHGEVPHNALRQYNNELAIRFSMNNLSKDGKVLNIPLFMIEYLENLIG